MLRPQVTVHVCRQFHAVLATIYRNYSRSLKTPFEILGVPMDASDDQVACLWLNVY